MKKTLVAVAAMVAVTGAMAQATISGMIDGAYTTNRSTTSGGVSTTANSVTSAGAGQSQITFATSEDLGGGMKAIANIRVAPSPFTGAIAQDVSEVGVSGDFGTAMLVRDYGIDFLVHAAADASGSSFHDQARRSPTRSCRLTQRVSHTRECEPADT